MRKSPQEEGAARGDMADDPTVELEMLEQTLSIEGARVLRHDALGLVCAPIPRAWIVDGNPGARSKPLAGSSDGLASAMMWDCTAGRFNWFYDADEIAHVLEGSAVIQDAAGVSRALRAGDTFLFPAGSRYQWTIPGYVRKIAFLHSPLPQEVRVVNGILERLKAPFRRRRAGSAEFPGG